MKWFGVIPAIKRGFVFWILSLIIAFGIGVLGFGALLASAMAGNVNALMTAGLFALIGVPLIWAAYGYAVEITYKSIK